MTLDTLCQKDALRFATAMRNIHSFICHQDGWYIVNIGSSGVDIDGPFRLGEACEKRATIPFPTFLMRGPAWQVIPLEIMNENPDAKIVLLLDKDEIVGASIIGASIIGEDPACLATLDDERDDEWQWRSC